MTPELTIVPANEASREDLQAAFPACAVIRPGASASGTKMQHRESWASVGAEELAFRFRTQTECGHRKSGTTSGLVAYLDGEPVGWCAVEPRTAYPRLLLKDARPLGRPSGGQERRQRLGRDLLRHPHGFPAPRRQPCACARRRRFRARTRRPCARGLPHGHSTHGEGHPVERAPCRQPRHLRRPPGFAEVGRPTIRRAVMRIDFFERLPARWVT